MILLIYSLIVVAVVLIHYEFLYRFSKMIPHMKMRHRFRIVSGVFSALIAHTIEVFIFAVAYYYLNKSGNWGYLSGNFNGNLTDCIYYSFTTYTTLGFGDIVPFGKIRFLTGLESLTGLVLITWTASFLYYEMQRYWDEQ